MPSTSDPAKRFAVAPLWQPFLGVVVIAGAALVQSRLTLAAMVFLAMTLASTSIRTATMGRLPVLPVAATVAARREKVLVILVFVGMIALPVVWLVSPLLDGATYASPVRAIILGAVVGAFSQWLFWRAHVDLGANWSPVLEVRDGHQLITSGIYSRIRHPMYAAIFAQVAAQVLLIGNWIAGPSGLVAFAVLYVVRIGREERMMAETFGTAWHDYAARTGRLWPRLRPA